MAVPAVNITIEQGADFSSTFTITNSDGSLYNLLNTSAVAKIKKFPESETSYSFSTSVTVSVGKITISMSNALTRTIPSGRYYYDILLSNNITGLKTRVIEGMAFVSASIS
jgi:hypothetical protein